MRSERTAARHAENERRKAERAEDEVAPEIDALHRRVRQQRRLGLPHAAADDDLLAEVGPAVEAGAEQRPRPDQQSRSRAEPAERLAARHRVTPAGGRTDRTDQAAGRDDEIRKAAGRESVGPEV